MVTLMAMYPASAPFDRTYYFEKHMPLVEKNLAPHGLKKATVHTVSGTPSGSPAPYHVVTLLYFDDAATLESAFGTPDGAAVVADIPNFFKADPVLVVAEVAS
jgi:uncharacterized protein (TIGR02118 family)